MNFFTNRYHRFTAWIRDLRMRARLDRSRRADLLLVHQVTTKRRLPSPRQWRYVGRVLTLAERRGMRIAFAFLGLGLLVLAVRWGVVHGHFVPASGGEYREGIVGAPHSVNPVLATSNDVDQDLIRLVYSGLYRRDAEARLTFDLAQSVDVSADGKTYTFKLRDAKFHDNTPVTADDVVFTFNMIQNPAWKSPLARNFKGITAVATDAATVTLTLDTPLAYLPSMLTVGILPKHIWAEVQPGSVALTDFNLKPVGSGPFKFEKFVRDPHGTILSYTVRAVDDRAMLERITFKFFEDYDTAVDKLTSNAVDGLNFVPSARRASVAALPGVEVRSPALSQYTAIFFNPKSQPFFSDARIREALARAIDRDRILKNALQGNATLRDAPIPEGAAGSTDTITRYPYDAAAANALLDTAGFPRLADTNMRGNSETSKPKTKKDQPVTTVTELAVSLTIADTEENRRVAAIIKENWEAVGVSTNIVPVSTDTIQKDTIKNRDYQAILFGEILGPDSDPFPFWHSSQIADGFNLAGYNNRRVDEMLEKARRTTNDVDRGALLAEFQSIVTKEVPAIFLYQPTYSYPQSTKLRGFDVKRMITPADRFANVAEWYRRIWISFR